MKHGAGDAGKTWLPSRGRISKSAIELCAIGDLDELGAAIGFVAAVLPTCCAEMQPLLVEVQRALSQIGSFCAGCSEDSFECAMRKALSGLDCSIATLDDELPTLRHFILPGGHRAACAAHVARAVCRRAERSLVALVEAGAGDPDGVTYAVLAYLNRLSSFLFSTARLVNVRSGCDAIDSSR